MVCVILVVSSSGIRAAPGVCWMQWAGQRRVVYCSDGLSGLVMVVVSMKGCLGGSESCCWWWLLAKEMWLGGCQSLVAILRGRIVAGSARRVLISGVMSRPEATAREPFCLLRGVFS
jgi:hypothetical protein